MKVNTKVYDLHNGLALNALQRSMNIQIVKLTQSV